MQFASDHSIFEASRLLEDGSDFGLSKQFINEGDFINLRVYAQHI